MSLNQKYLKYVSRIVTHKNCPDGIASAMILHDVFPEACIEFIQNSSREHKNLKATIGMLFCDFCPPQERLEEFTDFGAIVLDHHKASKNIVKEFGEKGIFADESEEPNISGASLAYREVWNVIKYQSKSGVQNQHLIKTFADVAAVRDTFQTNSELWERSCNQALFLQLYDTKYLLNGHSPWISEEELKIGKALYRKRQNNSLEMSKGAFKFIIEGGDNKINAIIFNDGGVEKYISDVAGCIKKSDPEIDLCISFHLTTGLYSNSPSIFYSFRSNGNFDCAKFCKIHGGGGHVKAGGFSYFVNPFKDYNPIRIIRDLIRSYFYNNQVRRDNFSTRKNFKNMENLVNEIDIDYKSLEKDEKENEF